MGVRMRLGLAITALALVSACGSGDGGGNRVASLESSASTSTQQQAGGGNGEPSKEEFADSARKFAKCMREHGVDMPDPKIGDGGSISIELGGNPDDAKLKE